MPPAHWIRKGLFWTAWLACGLWTTVVPAAPGSALYYDGTNGFVQVAHNANLNAFPFTVTAWFRSTNTSPVAQGIVSKYADMLGNGWSLMMQGGYLRGFYYRGNLSDRAIDATTASPVADGFWHYAALTVDTNGGKLYLDGIQVGSGTWTGSAGAPTGTEPLLVGRYCNFANRFLGTIDEVTVWNRTLGRPELNYIKHRQLNGNEDGLLALWHFDENGGPTAGDATTHGYTGMLSNNPVWVTSSAPLVFNQISINALRFSGGNDYVGVAHNTNLNSLPFTATAWFLTTNNSPAFQGIVNKYIDSSGNGWALILQGGHLRGFYYAGGGANLAIDATSAGLVSDGSWHHAALVVDNIGGKLYLDGAQVGSGTWTVGAQVPITTAPLLIGRYYSAAYPFSGIIDEVTVWKTALTPAQIAADMNAPLTGAETGLVALWRLDEASGTTASDATGNGYDGTLNNGPLRTGSTAFLGDGTSVIHTTLGNVQWARQFAVTTIPAQRGFAANGPFWVRRLDDFGAPGGTTSVFVNLQSSLQSTLLAGPVPLVNNSTQFNLSLPSYLAAAPQATAGGVITSPLLDIEPQSGTQLDSVNDTLRLSVSEFYSINSGPQLTAETISLAPAKLLHFDGNLLFGPVATAFTSIANTPTRGSPGGGGINTQLAVNNNSGYLVASPSHTYGNGSAINVVLLTNGDSIASSGSVPVTGPSPDIGTIQNISFTRSSLNLTPTGAVGFVALQLPLGFSIGISPSNHLSIPALEYPNTPLDPNLNPVPATLSTPGPLYGVEETLPYWFSAASVTWQIASGQIVLNPNGGVFVRQEEDDLLLSLQSSLVETNRAYRISNDGYFCNAVPTNNSLVVVADTNGVARIATQLALRPPELRPHFPYTSNTPSARIPVGTGLLIITDNLASASSYLTVTGAVPVLYGRDCTYIGCTATQAGPASLSRV